MIDLTFIKGKIVYDDLSPLKNIDPVDQIDLLKEDMLQVEYAGAFLLDIGWYPSFDITGSFQIRAIKDFDWGAPLFFAKAKTTQLLIKEMMAAQNAINKDQ
ncbi:hypothetical protein HCU66_26895 [Pseudomonas frederiksbergensis]|uniref:hypothetical protein n=1 Tax=Pseudomonas frederiksbergensis TaxID=104087 RepID=UPI0019817EEC|nr:hypothetical protein [Pseudomonas frederiksbergensis]